MMTSEKKSIRDVLLSELNNFRFNLRATWGGFGRSSIGNLFGFFLKRGFGVMFNYTATNYARIYLDEGNDGGSTTPSWIFDMPASEKIKIQGNTGHSIVRIYGRGGEEVGNPGVTFPSYGAFDLFCPFRQMEWTVGSANDPETIAGFAQNGFSYIRNNAGTRAFRIYLNGSWKTVTVT